jgi:hypothetical protein
VDLYSLDGIGGHQGQRHLCRPRMHNSPIQNPPVLQDVLSNKLHINVLVFGQSLPLTMFLHTWSRHMVSH